MAAPNTAPAAQAVSLNDAVKITGLGRNRLYEEMKAGRLRGRKSGKRRIFLVKDLEAFLDQLPAA